MPLAAVTGRADVMDSIHSGGLGGTYGGNPVACAVYMAGRLVGPAELLVGARGEQHVAVEGARLHADPAPVGSQARPLIPTEFKQRGNLTRAGRHALAYEQRF